MSVNDIDRDVPSRIIWGEARGEGLLGQIAVAWTISNRVDDGNPTHGGRRLCRSLSEAVSVHLLAQERPELPVSDRIETDLVP